MMKLLILLPAFIFISGFACPAQEKRTVIDPCSDIALYLENFPFCDTLNYLEAHGILRVSVAINNHECEEIDDVDVKYRLESVNYFVNGKSYKAYENLIYDLPRPVVWWLKEAKPGQRLKMQAVVSYYNKGKLIKKIPLKRTIFISDL